MTQKLRVLGASLAVLSAGLLARADTPPRNLGKKIANFTLTAPLDRAAVSLADFKDKKAIVVVFVGTECPINNLFLPRLAELHQEYSAKGVQFLAINANRQDTLERIAVRCGFGTGETLRRVFRRRLNVSPDSYRRCFRVVTTEWTSA